MPAKRQGAYFSVYVALYASEEVQARVERLEEDFSQPGRILAQSFYNGYSQAQAARAFVRAGQFAMQNPLAFLVVMQRDAQTLIQMKPERD